ncbi:MAG: hypothetical protein K1X94_00600 [Sandaracinaceae bacterium]|nr:hypothetical protein [Sandaracinaceae bacterium]
MTDENETRAFEPDASDPRRRHPDPPRVRDALAHAHFAALVLAAVDELAALAAPLVAVASSPNRFNDVAWYDWALVRVGSEVVERDAYCVSESEHRGELARASDRARAASRVLERLEHAGWRELFTQSYGLGFDDELLALVVQEGARWLVYASSNCGGREHVFALGGHEPIAYEAECVTRTDDELIDGRGLVFARWDDPF